MQLTLLTTIAAFACTALAIAPPYEGRLNQCQAEVIVDQYKSILENVTYNGQLPIETASQIIAPNYEEYSDSVLSLVSKNNTLDGHPATVGSTAWFNGVTQHPLRGIITRDIFVAGTNNVLWYWTFTGVGIASHNVTGFNLLRIDENFQVYRADIEFNSIAWGLDIFELQQYCEN